MREAKLRHVVAAALVVMLFSLAIAIAVVSIADRTPKRYAEEDVAIIAKAIYSDECARQSDLYVSAVTWSILNRLDSPRFQDSIYDVVLLSDNAYKYMADNPVDERIAFVVRDVLDRWSKEKDGKTDVGRTLPAEYVFYDGGSMHIRFTTLPHSDDAWDWSLPNPYEN